MKNTITRALATLAAAAGLVALVVAGASTAPADATAAEQRTASAIVRLGPNWAVHTNARHAAVGIESVKINADGDLEVRRNDLTAGWKIMTCITDEDETMVKLGVNAGCSGGGGLSVIRMYDRDGNHVRADDPMFGEFANIWFSSIVQQ